MLNSKDAALIKRQSCVMRDDKSGGDAVQQGESMFKPSVQFMAVKKTFRPTSMGRSVNLPKEKLVGSAGITGESVKTSRNAADTPIIDKSVQRALVGMPNSRAMNGLTLLRPPLQYAIGTKQNMRPISEGATTKAENNEKIINMRDVNGAVAKNAAKNKEKPPEKLTGKQNNGILNTTSKIKGTLVQPKIKEIKQVTQALKSAKENKHIKPKDLNLKNKDKLLKDNKDRLQDKLVKIPKADGNKAKTTKLIKEYSNLKVKAKIAEMQIGKPQRNPDRKAFQQQKQNVKPANVLSTDMRKNEPALQQEKIDKSRETAYKVEKSMKIIAKPQDKLAKNNVSVIKKDTKKVETIPKLKKTAEMGTIAAESKKKKKPSRKIDEQRLLRLAQPRYANIEPTPRQRPKREINMSHLLNLSKPRHRPSQEAMQRIQKAMLHRIEKNDLPLYDCEGDEGFDSELKKVPNERDESKGTFMEDNREEKINEVDICKGNGTTPLQIVTETANCTSEATKPYSQLSLKLFDDNCLSLKLNELYTCAAKRCCFDVDDSEDSEGRKLLNGRKRLPQMRKNHKRTSKFARDAAAKYTSDENTLIPSYREKYLRYLQYRRHKLSKKSHIRYVKESHNKTYC